MGEVLDFVVLYYWSGFWEDNWFEKKQRFILCENSKFKSNSVFYIYFISSIFCIILLTRSGDALLFSVSCLEINFDCDE